MRCHSAGLAAAALHPQLIDPHCYLPKIGSVIASSLPHAWCGFSFGFPIKWSWWKIQLMILWRLWLSVMTGDRRVGRGWGVEWGRQQEEVGIFDLAVSWNLRFRDSAAPTQYYWWEPIPRWSLLGSQAQWRWTYSPSFPPTMVTEEAEFKGGMADIFFVFVVHKISVLVNRSEGSTVFVIFFSSPKLASFSVI